MIEADAIHTVIEGAEPLPFKLRDFELPEKAQIQFASEAPYIVQYQPNPVDHSEGQFVFGRAGLAKVILTWHTEDGKFITRTTHHFAVQPAHWSSSP